MKSKICWWCGIRAPSWKFADLVADHVVTMAYASPTAIACRFCNYRRRGVIPDGDKLRRLFFDGRVVRSVAAGAVRAYVGGLADRFFPGHPRGRAMIIAKSGTLPLLFGPNKPAPELTRVCVAGGWSPPTQPSW